MSHEVAALEDRRDHLCKFTSFYSSPSHICLRTVVCLVSLILRQNQRPQSAHCPFPGCVCTEGGPDGVSAYPRKLSTYDSDPMRYAPHAAHRPPASSGLIPSMRPAYAWDDREREDSGSPHASSSASASVGGSPARKHARSWDSEVSKLFRLFFAFRYPDIAPLVRLTGTGKLFDPFPCKILLLAKQFSFSFTDSRIMQDPPIRKRRAGSVSRSPPMLVS